MNLYQKRMHDNYIHKTAILTHIPANRKINVLDFGGGTGVVGRMIKDTHTQAIVTYVDHNSEMLEVAKALNSAHQYFTNLDAVSWNSFDVIVLCSVLHEVEEWKELVSLLVKNYLKDGGKLIIRDGLKKDTFLSDKTDICYELVDEEDAFDYWLGLDRESKIAKLDIRFYGNYIKGETNDIRAFLQSYTWGVDSREREQNEYGLLTTIRELKTFLGKKLLNNIQITPIRQYDYFHYMSKIIKFDTEWDTHFLAIGTKGGDIT